MDKNEMSFFTEREKIILSGGGELNCVITMPKSETLKGLNRFYAGICERCMKFCENELKPSFDSSSHFYSYRVHSQADTQRDRITVLMRVTLTDRSAAHTVERTETTHVWRYGMLIRSKKGSR